MNLVYGELAGLSNRNFEFGC